MPKGRPLDYTAVPAPKSDTGADGEKLINLSKDLHKGEDEWAKMYERETGLNANKPD